MPALILSYDSNYLNTLDPRTQRVPGEDDKCGGGVIIPLPIVIPAHAGIQGYHNNITFKTALFKVTLSLFHLLLNYQYFIFIHWILGSSPRMTRPVSPLIIYHITKI